MKPILVIDNYDSFVYNLVHYLQEFGADVVVKRNDKIEIEEVANYSKILFSPGPGIPEEAGKMLEIIKEYTGKTSMLGVCLGHQAIAEAFGGKLTNLKEVFHGVATKVKITESDYLFDELPKEFNVGRYHSWVTETKLPDCLSVTAVDEEGIIMALKHNEFDIRGVQFHPESVLTEHGKEIMKNWLKN